MELPGGDQSLHPKANCFSLAHTGRAWTRWPSGLAQGRLQETPGLSACSPPARKPRASGLQAEASPKQVKGTPCRLGRLGSLGFESCRCASRNLLVPQG